MKYLSILAALVMLLVMHMRINSLENRINSLSEIESKNTATIRTLTDNEIAIGQALSNLARAQQTTNTSIADLADAQKSTTQSIRILARR